MKTRKITHIISFAIAFVFAIQGFSQVKKDKKAIKYAKTIKAEELKEKLYIYASDEFEGRGTPSKGQELAIKYLEKLGNPYSDVLIDANANIGIDWGVYGLPETFIVDSNSIIKYRLVGPITKNNFEAFISKIKEIKN